LPNDPSCIYQTVHFSEYPGHWIFTPEHDRNKALQWARRNRDALIHRKTETFASYCAGFFAPDGSWVRKMTRKGHHYTDKYLLTRQKHLDLYAVPEFGDCQPAEIKRLEIDNWLLDLKKKNGKDLAGETKNKIMYSMGLVFEYLKDIGIVQETPVAGIKPYDKAPLRLRGVIDRESLAKLYPASHGALVRVWGSSMWASLMLFFNDTGSRPGEVRALTWADIDTNKDWTPYWLRHSFGTYQMETLSQDEIMKLMGHNVEVTTRIYQHPDNETLYKSAEEIKKKLDKARESG
jgi:integrase